MLSYSTNKTTTSDDPPNEADSRPCHGGSIPDGPNYQNNILIPIIERILSDGAEALQLVDLAHKQELGDKVLHLEDNLHKNWVKMLCTNFKKPTGTTGSDKNDWIHRCIKIEWCIQRKTNSEILGGSSANENNDLPLPKGDDDDIDDDNYNAIDNGCGTDVFLFDSQSPQHPMPSPMLTMTTDTTTADASNAKAASTS